MKQCSNYSPASWISKSVIGLWDTTKYSPTLQWLVSKRFFINRTRYCVGLFVVTKAGPTIGLPHKKLSLIWPHYKSSNYWIILHDNLKTWVWILSYTISYRFYLIPTTASLSYYRRWFTLTDSSTQCLIAINFEMKFWQHHRLFLVVFTKRCTIRNERLYRSLSIPKFKAN